MHYIIDDFVIKSEYSALPINRYNKVVRAYMQDFFLKNKDPMILDYGCGKLRNTYPFIENYNITGVDSPEQINRIQKIDGKYTTLTELSTRYDKLTIIPSNHVKMDGNKYDLILCNNVFSAIPYNSEIIDILCFVKNHLTNKGRALLSVQYKNSYFESFKGRKNSFYYNGGWVVKNKNKNSYYRIIKPTELINLVLDSKLTIISQKINKGSIYLEVCSMK